MSPRSSGLPAFAARVLLLLAVTAGLSREATAMIVACTAADVIAADSGCPNTNAPCMITEDFILGDGCTLDFGDRAVTLTKNGSIAMNQLVVFIDAGSFVMAAGATIDGEGIQGGQLTITTSTGDIVVERTGSTNARISMGGQSFGGIVTLVAGGNVIVDGIVRANSIGPNAAGGSIAFNAAGDIVTGAQSTIDPKGGPQETGGALDLVAGGRILIGKTIEVGGDGGTILASAGSSFTLGGGARLLANGGGDGADAGDISIRAEEDIEINGQVQAKGSSDGIGGGFGGEISVDSLLGNIIIRSEISTRSGAPDGDGGAITISTSERVGGSIEISRSGGELNAEGNGVDSGTDESRLRAGLDVTVNGRILASGGVAGGDLLIEAGRHVTIDADIDARGRSPDSFGGTVVIEAGTTMSGNVSIDEEISVRGGDCGGGLCSAAGDVEVAGCDLTIALQGHIDATAPGPSGTGGVVLLMARRALRVDGTIAATAATTGVVDFYHPDFVPPFIPAGRVMPPATLNACDDCLGACASFCLQLCDCGDGDVDPFEECDGPGVCSGSEVCGVQGTPQECSCIATCGNGMLDDGEQCDTLDFGGGSCELLGFPGGGLLCRNDCTIDTSGCDPITCGDGTVDEGEACEPDDLGGETCASLGFAGGTLTCAADCLTFDDGACNPGTCGDGVRCFNEGCTTGPGGGAEECDDGNTSNSDECLNDCSLAACGDGALCSEEGCSTGAGNDAEDCDDGNTSNADACLDDCTGAVCGDGLVCSSAACTSGPTGGAEECDGGACCLSDCAIRPCNETACVPGFLCCPPNADCDDGNPCTTDGCSVSSGCTHVANDAVCDDGNPCTTDACSLSLGCTHIANQSPCDDGNACSVGDVCAGGSCTAAAARDCDDGNSCTRDRCDPASGCVHTPDVTLCSVLTVPGKKIALKTKASKPKKNKLTLLLKGQFSPPPVTGVPTVAGASLRVRDSSGQDVTFPLPVDAWKARGSKFTYKDGKARNGPCTKVVFKAGKSIKATCKGEGITLLPELIEPVQVILRSGDTFYCAAFGGKVSKNSNGTFVATSAEAPAQCSAALITPRQ